MFKCISALRLASWEPVYSHEYIATLNHLLLLLDTKAAEGVTVRNDYIITEQQLKTFITTNLGCLLPKGISILFHISIFFYYYWNYHNVLCLGLNKRDITKIISHSSAEIQLVGFMIIMRLLSLTSQMLGKDHEGELSELFEDFVVDFASIYSLRTK